MFRSCRTQLVITVASVSVLFLLVTKVSYRERGDSSLVTLQPLAFEGVPSLRDKTGGYCDATCSYLQL